MCGDRLSLCVAVNDLDDLEFDLLPGRLLRMDDRLLWARREYVIRHIAPGLDPDVAWLTLAEIRVGFIKENALVLPIVLSAGDYRRILR